MTPRLRKNRPLRFAEDFCFEDFEFLCRDLMEKESGIGSVAFYGAPPQGQHGIDIIGYHSDGDCCDVAQCKNYRGFKKADLTKMLKKFWASWDYWQLKKVRRFILCVGGPARDAKLQDEIQAERPRFLAKGIIFDVWDDATLTAKLADNPSVAYRHCDEAVAKQLCGPIVEVGDVGRATLAMFQTTLEECGGEFEQTMEKELPRIRETARCGHTGEAFDAMAELRASPRWRLLDARTRARGLRLAASLHLDHKDDVATAKSLIAEGARLAPEESYQVIEAAIAYREAGVEIALKILDSPRDLAACRTELRAVKFRESPQADFHRKFW